MIIKHIKLFLLPALFIVLAYHNAYASNNRVPLDSIFCKTEILLQEGKVGEAFTELESARKRIKTQSDKVSYNYLKGLILIQDSLYDSALVNFIEALEIKELKKENDCEKTRILHQIGRCFLYKDNMEQAESYFRKAIINNDLYDLNCPIVSETYLCLLRIYPSIGLLELMDDCLLKLCDEINKYVYIDEKKVKAINYLRYDYNIALYYFQDAIAICEKTFFNDESILTYIYGEIGQIHYLNGEYDKALEYYEKELIIDKKIYGEDHPNVSASYNDIAIVYSLLGRNSEALEYYEKVLNIEKRIHGENHPNVAITYNSISSLCSLSGRYFEALEYSEKALYIEEKFLGENNREVGTTYANIAVAYCGLGQYSEALKYSEKALYIKEKLFGKNHPDVAIIYNNIAVVYKKIGQYSEALEYFEKALLSYPTSNENHSDIIITYSNMASVYSMLEEYSKALVYFQKVDNYEELLLIPYRLNYLNNYGLILLKLDNPLKALAIFEKGKELSIKHLGEGNEDLCSFIHNIGCAYMLMCDYNKALEYLTQAKELYIIHGMDVCKTEQRIKECIDKMNGL